MDKIKYAIKRMIMKIIDFINRKTQKTPRLRRFLININNRIHIVKDRKSLNTVRKMKGTKKDTKIKPFNKLKVAVILDEFSYNSFKDDFECIVITPDDWMDKFTKEKPDIFLCESAWSGTDSELRHWKGKIYTSINFNSENRLVLLSILEYCRKNHIPTVFWNKEDPSHYPDKVHNFVDTAVKFDHIFTTAEECIDLYKNEYGHKSVHSLMFATNPKLFNPIRKYDRTNELIFAGSWYNYLEQRCIDIQKILDNAIEQNIEIMIYDRYYNYKADENHVWPEKYRKYIKPSLNYTEIDKAYKSSNFALNFTSVTESKTMFARRVFEIMSCRTTIVSNYSVGIEFLLGGNVIFANDDMKLISDDNKLEENLYLALSEHTYRNRFKHILDTIGFQYEDIKEDITFYFVIEREEDIEKAVETFRGIDYNDKKYAFILPQSIDNTIIKDIFQKYNSIDCTVISADYCLKYGELKCMTKYFMITDLNSAPDNEFIKKALLHFSYIDENTGIAQASDNNEKYTFKESRCLNSIYCSSKIQEIFNDYEKQQILYII